MIWTCKGVRRAPNCHLYTTRRSCSKSRTVASGLYIKHLCPVWWCVLFVSYWQLWILWLHIELELLNTEHGQHWIQVREADQERRRLILRNFLYCVPWKAWLQPFLIFCSCSIWIWMQQVLCSCARCVSPVQRCSALAHGDRRDGGYVWQRPQAHRWAAPSPTPSSLF